MWLIALFLVPRVRSSTLTLYSTGEYELADKIKPNKVRPDQKFMVTGSEYVMDKKRHCIDGVITYGVELTWVEAKESWRIEKDECTYLHEKWFKWYWQKGEGWTGIANMKVIAIAEHANQSSELVDRLLKEIREMQQKLDEQERRLSKKMLLNNKVLEKYQNEKTAQDQEIERLKDIPYFGTYKLQSLTLSELKARETDTAEYLNKVKKQIQIKEKDERSCKICMVAETDYLINPCGHCFCRACINKITKCAICRKNIKGTIKIHKY